MEATPDKADWQAFRRSCEILLRGASFGLRIAKPFRVVLIGPPNVGKSSLINAIVGYERSISHHEAGTTRDLLHAETVIEGLPIQLTDTAGLRESVESIESEGIARAHRMAAEADLIVRVQDPHSGGTFSSNPASTEAIEPTQSGHPPQQLDILNKCDLLPQHPSLQIEGRIPTVNGKIAVSAKTGFGIDTLLLAIVEALVPQFPAAGMPLLLTQRQVECVRRAANAGSASEGLQWVRELINGALQ